MDQIRAAVKLRFEAFMRVDQDWQGLSFVAQTTLINDLEEGCFEEATKDNTMDNRDLIAHYSTVCYKINHMLDVFSEPNAFLRKKLITGEIQASNAGRMQPHELYPEASQKERDFIYIRQNQTTENKTSHIYKCYTCGSNEVDITEKQSKSADELSTIIITCKQCGTRLRS